MTPPPLTREEFVAFVKRAGLSFTAAELDEFYVAYGHVVAMCERVRSPRTIMAEPALTFSPLQEAAA